MTILAGNERSAALQSAPGVVVILAVTYAIYGAFGAFTIVNGQIWLDEVSYLVKSWQYVNGTVRPYTDDDATWYMPLYFYQLGHAQEIFGQGHIVGRAMSCVLGGASGALVFVICRRLTVDNAASALAVAVYLLTPTTAYYFSTVTPIATVALLNVAAILIVLASVDRPRLSLTVGFGAIVAILFFYRQNTILSSPLLAIAFLYGIRKNVLANAIIALASAALVSAVLISIFPAKIVLYAVRLPIITPALSALSLLPDSYQLILDSVDTPYSLGFVPAAFSWGDIINAFGLPYAGTTALSLAACASRRVPKRMKAVPAAFFVLAAAHYLGSASFCRLCVQTYTNYFVAIGAVAAGLALAAISNGPGASWLRTRALAAGAALAAICTNIFAISFTVPDSTGAVSAYRYFPKLAIAPIDGVPESALVGEVAQVIAAHTGATDVVLPLQRFQSIPYAIFLAGRSMPVQALNLAQSFRHVRDTVPAAARANVVKALEGESLWAYDTLLRWLETGVDAILLEDGSYNLGNDALGLIATEFTQRAEIHYRGSTLRLYVRNRRSGQP